MHGNLVAIVPHFLQLLVVGVLVGHVEGGLEWVEGQLQKDYSNNKIESQELSHTRTGHPLGFFRSPVNST